MNTLISGRCNDNPPSFRQITFCLNEHHARIGTCIDRSFTALNCANKWGRLFPGALDANRSVQYCQRLQRKWPGLKYFTETEKPDTEINSSPKLLALHIIWPWAKKIMMTLRGSIFGDATYNLTVFGYKVIFLSTLDGMLGKKLRF